MDATHDEHERPDAVPPSAEAPRSPDPAGRRQVILLVEDSEEDREFYGRLLWYNGFDVVHAPDGESAVEKALATPPDLILLDIMLPGEMNGLDVARRLRQRGLTTPIIALSAHPRDELEPASREAGVQIYLQKPIDPFAVVREVARHIGYARGDDSEGGGGGGTGVEGQNVP